MATNLTAAQLAELQRLFSTPTGSGDGNAYMPNTVDYGGQTYKQDGSGGFVGTGPLYGDNQYHFNNYDTGGAQTAEGEGQMSSWSPEKLFAASVLGLVGGGLAMGGPAGFGFGGAGGMTNGAFLGEAPWTATGGGALDFGAGTGAMGAGAGGAGGAAYGTMAPLEQMAMPAGVSGAAGLSTMAVPGAASLIPGISNGSLLGAGATLLGAAAGAQGQNAEQSTAKDIPEWLKPYANKQLGYAGGLLDKQMAPGYMAGYDQMRTIGQGLLSQPIAGNGFDQFMQRPRFGGQ